jgi:hypothetical protein
MKCGLHRAGCAGPFAFYAAPGAKKSNFLPVAIVARIFYNENIEHVTHAAGLLPARPVFIFPAAAALRPSCPDELLEVRGRLTMNFRALSNPRTTAQIPADPLFAVHTAMPSPHVLAFHPAFFSSPARRPGFRHRNPL